MQRPSLRKMSCEGAESIVSAILRYGPIEAFHQPDCITEVIVNLRNVSKKGSQSLRAVDAARAAEGMNKAERLWRLQNEVRGLKAGQTIQGTVVGREGNSVQIELAQDFTINAKLDKSVSIALGQMLSFEVKANSNSFMSLAPLYTNTANTATILRALSAAALPETAENIEMVARMMEEGMPIDKESILNMSREILDFPGQSPAAIVQMTKLGLPVTEANIEQFVLYKNANHQILGSAETITKELPQVFQALAKEGQGEKALALYQSVIDVLTGDQGDGAVIRQEAGGAQAQNAMADQSAQQGQGAESAQGTAEQGTAQGQSVAASQGAAQGQSAAAEQGAAQDISAAADQSAQQGQSAAAQGAEQGKNGAAQDVTQHQSGVAVQGAEEPSQTAGQAGQFSQAAPEGAGILLPQAEGQAESAGAQDAAQGRPPVLSEGQWESLAEALRRLGVDEKSASQVKSGSLSPEETLRLVKHLIEKTRQEGEGAGPKGEALQKLLGGREFQSLLREQLLRQWTIEPKDVADKKQVEQLYERIREQTARLSQALAEAGKADAPVARSLQNLQNNVDFMNQMNQMYSYVQLPLKMFGSKAHGDLYVYTNKKNLAAKDGNLSALLHLDMEHLGPLDVYVTMQNKQVSTNFTVADDEVLTLIAQHIDILNRRLSERGYSLKANMQVKSAGEEPESVMQTILRQQKNISTLSRTSFDMRA